MPGETKPVDIIEFFNSVKRMANFNTDAEDSHTLFKHLVLMISKSQVMSPVIRQYASITIQGLIKSAGYKREASPLTLGLVNTGGLVNVQLFSLNLDTNTWNKHEWPLKEQMGIGIAANWASAFVQNPVRYAAYVISTSSQVIDYFCSEEISPDRAKALQAEYFNCLENAGYRFQRVEEVKEVLHDYPNGCKSLHKKLIYDINSKIKPINGLLLDMEL